jgi:predicted MFS family arabinose efflux permease
MGSMMLLTYLVPYIQELLGVGDGIRSVVFSVMGVAGTVGVFAGGFATDKLGPDRTIRLGLGTFTAVMLALVALWSVRPVSLFVFMPLVAIWGVTAYISSPAVQTRLHSVAGDLTAQALALNTSVGYLGISLGGALGGLIVSEFEVKMLPAGTAVASVIALLLLTLAFRGGPVRGASGDTRPAEKQGADQ